MPAKQRQVTIKAKFTGTDRSLGYRTNKSYKLVVTLKRKTSFLPIWLAKLLTFRDDRRLVIMRQNPNLSSFNWGLCPYRNKKAFLSNWEIKRGSINRLWK